MYFCDPDRPVRFGGVSAIEIESICNWLTHWVALFIAVDWSLGRERGEQRVCIFAIQIGQHSRKLKPSFFLRPFPPNFNVGVCTGGGEQQIKIKISMSIQHWNWGEGEHGAKQKLGLSFRVGGIWFELHVSAIYVWWKIINYVSKSYSNNVVV